MKVLSLPFRRLLVALFAAWLPLACCCQVRAAEVAPGSPSGSDEHRCCGETAPAMPVPAHHPDESEAPACECDGDLGVVSVAVPAAGVPDSPLVGELPFWGNSEPSVDLIAANWRFIEGAFRAPPRALAPTLRALSVLLTV